MYSHPLTYSPQQFRPRFWLFSPKFITECFVTLKLITLHFLLSKYEAMNGADSVSGLPTLLLGGNRIEDMIMAFFENCELGRNGYLLVSPIRRNTTQLLVHFQQYVSGHLERRAPPHRRSMDDDLFVVRKSKKYRSLNAKRSHSENCVADFRKFMNNATD